MSQVSFSTLLKSLEITLAEKEQEVEYCEGKVEENKRDIKYYELILGSRRETLPQYQERILGCKKTIEDTKRKIDEVKDKAIEERKRLKIEEEITALEAQLHELQKKKAGLT